MANEVFVSYSRKDRDRVIPWVQRLQAAGVPLWIDERGIDGARLWGQEIAEAIEGCKLLILMASPSSVTSDAVVKEVSLASEGKKPILPLLLEPVAVPAALRFHLAGIHQIELFGADSEERLQAILRSLARLGVQGSQKVEGRDALAPEPSLRDPPSRRTASVRRQHPLQKLGSPPIGPSHSSGEQLGAHGAASHAGTGQAATRVAILYKRHAQPDAQLLSLLETQLCRHGYQVFVDRHLTIGEEWLKAIERELRITDAVIPLLSAASVHSEVLTYELQTAHEAAQQQEGKPRLLPVRVNYTGPLPDALAPLLGPLHYTLWESPEDNDRLVAELIRALRNPPAPRTRISLGKLGPVGGALPLTSELYVVRRTDEGFRAAMARQDGIILVKGARQMGKTSLLVRGLQHAREAGAKVIWTDLQMLDMADLESVDRFFRAVAEWIADQLELDVLPDQVWKPHLGSSVNFARYLRREVLGKVAAPLVWGLDEADRLFPCAFGSQVFGLFRAWYNERQIDPTAPWSRLTLAIAYATEAHLFISDMNQSPFNVGTRLALEDFTLEQIADLNHRCGSPLRNDAELERYFALVGGHPYLVHRGLHEMAAQGMDVTAMEVQADRNEGIFGDHLRRIFILLVKDPELCDAVRGVLQGEPCPTSESFYRLRSAGVLAGESASDARPRCQLYATYLERHLR